MRVERFDGADLYLGDALELAPEITGVDALISDPPYGMRWNTDSSRYSGGFRHHDRGKGGRSDWGSIRSDDRIFDPSPWLAYRKVALWGCNHFGAQLPVGSTLVWIKRLDPAFGSFLSDAELAWVKGGHGVYCRRDTSMASFNGRAGTPRARSHPTQKPVGIMEWCLERAKVGAGELVLDPYMGSASTGIACIRRGVRFVGIEIDQAHFDSACRRIEAELRAPALELAVA